MTDEIVQDAIKAWATVVAVKLNVPNALDLSDLVSVDVMVSAVSAHHAGIGMVLQNFLIAYQDWWNLSKQNPLPDDKRQLLIELITNRDETRRALIEALKSI